MTQKLFAQIQNIIRRAPATWLMEVCAVLRDSPETATANAISEQLPPTGNADLAFLVKEIVDAADGVVTWEALGFGVQTAYDAFIHEQKEHRIEMLWSGPSPAGYLPARRIDQALYTSLPLPTGRFCWSHMQHSKWSG